MSLKQSGKSVTQKRCLRRATPFLTNSANNIDWRKCRKPPSARRLTNRGFNVDD